MPLERDEFGAQGNNVPASKSNGYGLDVIQSRSMIDTAPSAPDRCNFLLLCFLTVSLFQLEWFIVEAVFRIPKPD